jgi:hypothetical protein
MIFVIYKQNYLWKKFSKKSEKNSIKTTSLQLDNVFLVGDYEYHI